MVIVVVATAKVQIFKQITTNKETRRLRFALLLLPQRYKFSSKSQRVERSLFLSTVVVATAKVQIFKQITTRRLVAFSVQSLLLLPQRYKFSSKSQPVSVLLAWASVVVATAKVQIFKQITTVEQCAYNVRCCCCYRKGTNFQANHNRTRPSPPTAWVVVATAKVQIFKQITTLGRPQFHDVWLLLLPQRYKFSSKSQQAKPR